MLLATAASDSSYFRGREKAFLLFWKYIDCLGQLSLFTKLAHIDVFLMCIMTTADTAILLHMLVLTLCIEIAYVM